MLLSYLVEVCSLFLHTVSLFFDALFFLEYLMHRFEAGSQEL